MASDTDIKAAQSLDDFGGVHWRQVRRNHERHRIGERGPFIVWGFKQGGLQAWASSSLIKTYLTGKTVDRSKPGGGFETVNTGWDALWAGFDVLEGTDLVEMVGHVINADTTEGTVLHPYGMRNGEPGEQAVAVASHEAGLVKLNEAKRADAVAAGDADVDDPADWLMFLVDVHEAKEGGDGRQATGIICVSPIERLTEDV